jgi:hypothetical protein
MSNSTGLTNRTPCGTHVELAKHGAVRVTRCACGAVHLHLSRPGLTVQIAAEQLAELAEACGEAAREVEVSRVPARVGGDPCAN